MNAHKTKHARQKHEPTCIPYIHHWTSKHPPHMHCTYVYRYTTDSMIYYLYIAISLFVFEHFCFVDLDDYPTHKNTITQLGAIAWKPYMSRSCSRSWSDLHASSAHGYVYNPSTTNTSYVPNSRVDSERGSVSSGGRTDSDTMSISSCSMWVAASSP